MEAKICSNPSCCEYTSNFLEGNTECIKCMSYEPKVRKAKRYKKLTKEVFQEKYSDARNRARERREKEREKERKKRFTNFF